MPLRAFVIPKLATCLTTDFICSSDKAERHLGYQPVSLQAMPNDSHEWLVSQGLAKAAPEHKS